MLKSVSWFGGRESIWPNLHTNEFCGKSICDHHPMSGGPGRRIDRRDYVGKT